MTNLTKQARQQFRERADGDWQQLYDNLHDIASGACRLVRRNLTCPKCKGNSVFTVEVPDQGQRVKATEAIFNYGWGRPGAAAVEKTTVGLSDTELGEMAAADRRALIDSLLPQILERLNGGTDGEADGGTAEEAARK